MQILIQRVKVSQVVTGVIGITWEINDLTQDVSFFIERSGSPEGPFETINAIAVRQAFGYLDKSYNVESSIRQIYYRIRGVDNQNNTYYSPVTLLDQDESSYIGLAIARNKNVLLRRHVGTKCFVYIRKTFGKRCTACFDDVRQKSIASNCKVCYGTTFEGGYFSPIEMYVQLNPLLKANMKNEIQNAENLRIEGVWTTNYPILSPGDVIVEAKDQDNRYIIDNPIFTTSQHSIIVMQSFPVIKVQQSRIEHSIPVPKYVFSIDDVNIYQRNYN